MTFTGANVEIEIGRIVAGKFRIERTLARGGMGLVVAATHLQLAQTVALKFFRGDLGGPDGEPLARFMREAQAAAQLKSQHVARVLDVGLLSEEGGSPYMVMEYLEGQGLDKVIAADGPLDVASAVEYAIQACEGLAEAHARGIVHRDIKPSNLFLAAGSPGWRSIKILDFGISKVLLARASNITTSVNLVLGTPCYMSPEQFQSAASVDHRTDIWSLGSTLYEMLVGQPPVDPLLPLPAIAEEVVNKAPPPICELRPEIPRELSDIVARCMEKDRERRIPSAAALATALLPFAPERARVTAERAVAVTAPLGLRAAELRPAMTDLTQEAKTGVLWTQLGFASPTPVRHEDDAFEEEAPPESTAGDVVAPPPAGIAPGDRGGTTREVSWQPGVSTVVVLASLLIGAVVSLAVLRATPRTARSVAAAPAAATTSPLSAAPAPPAAARAQNRLVVRVSPASAQIMIDGAMVRGNPFIGRFAAAGIHQIQAFATGYEPKVEQASLAADLVVDLSLERRPAPPAGGTVQGRARPADRTFSGHAARPHVSSRALELSSGRSPVGPRSGAVDPRGGQLRLHPIETRSPYRIP